MFGYVKPFVSQLKVCEHEIYKGIYCGLCKQFGRSYNQLSRLTLSYDMTFFALLYIGLSDEKLNFENKRCFMHPFKKKPCILQCKALKLSADIGILFAFYKLKDNVADENFVKKFLSRFCKLGLLFSFKKAKHRQSEVSKIIKDFVKDQSKMEKKEHVSIDEACHPTAKALGLIAATLSNDHKNKDTLYRVGYMLGRYIYIIDAVDDLQKDLKNNSFNPFLQSFSLENKIDLELDSNSINSFDDMQYFNKMSSNMQKSEILKKAKDTLNFTIAQLAEAFELLPIKRYKPIINNIIYLGMKSSSEKVFERIDKISLKIK